MALACVSSMRYHCRPGFALALTAPGPVARVAAGLAFRAFLDILEPLIAIFQGRSPLAASLRRPGRAA
eukprot:5418119-Pyramimonas_sp.AAC.1